MRKITSRSFAVASLGLVVASFSINAIAASPTAAGPGFKEYQNDNVEVGYNSSVRINVLGNDTGTQSNGDTINSVDSYTLTIASGPSHGSAYLSGEDIYYYTETGYSGNDSFVYQVDCTVNGTPSYVCKFTVDVTVEEASDVQDSDGDGISDAEESAAPNDGDINDNGPDSMQDSIASMKNPVTSDYTAVTYKARPSLFEIEQATITPDNDNDEGYTHVSGNISFDVKVSADQEDIIIYHFTDLTPDEVSVRKSVDGEWSSLGDYVDYDLESVIIDGKSALKLTYPLTDQSEMDANDIEGEMADPIAFATKETTEVTGGVFEVK